MKRTVLSLTVLLLAGTALAGTAASSYTLTDLGVAYKALDLSDTGYVSGAVLLNGKPGAARWAPNGTMDGPYQETNPPWGVVDCWGMGIDDAGQMIGFDGAGNRAIIWDLAGNATMLPGYTDAYGNVNPGAGYDINDDLASGYGRDIWGTLSEAAWQYSGATWSGEPVGNDVGGFGNENAVRINANDWIVGNYYAGPGASWQAMAWEPGSDGTGNWTDHVLPGGGDRSTATDINDNANPTVVGYDAIAKSAHVWTTSDGGTTWNHQAVGDGANPLSALLGVNDDDVAVGVTDASASAVYDETLLREYIGQSTSYAAVWDATNGWQDLNTLVSNLPTGWALRSAQAIANDGTILVNAADNTGVNHAVLLTPEDANIPGDCDGDGDVDLTDLAILASNYGATEPPPLDQSNGDFDDDGDVDLTDLAILANNWGFGTMTVVPEPASAVILAFGGAMVWRIRRR